MFFPLSKKEERKKEREREKDRERERERKKRGGEKEGVRRRNACKQATTVVTTIIVAFLMVPFLTLSFGILSCAFMWSLIWILGSGSNRNFEIPSMHHGEMGNFVTGGQNSFCVFAFFSSVHPIQN